MACYGACVCGIVNKNKNKENNTQEANKNTPSHPFLDSKKLDAGRSFDDRGAPNGRAVGHARNRHWITLFGSGFAASCQRWLRSFQWSLKMLKSEASTTSGRTPNERR